MVMTAVKATMRDVRAGLAAFLGDESGAAAAEYGLLLAALVGLVAIAAAILGDSMTLVLRDAADCVEVGCV
jgi:Flp pilus assembly pilin Flp